MPLLIILLTLFFCHTADSSLVLEVTPKNSLFRLGDRRQLTCRLSRCSKNGTFSWSALGDKPLFADIQNFPMESTLTYKSVKIEHEYTVQCKAKCNGMFKQASVKVRVYSFPSDPVISGHDRMELGKNTTLTCKVSNVYSGEDVSIMEVGWLREGVVVDSDVGEVDKGSFQSEYTFTPKSDDNGKQITCRATLRIDGLDPADSIKEASVSMTVLSAPHNMTIPEPSQVMVGSSLTLKCEVDGNPKPDFLWRFLSPSGRLVSVGEAQELSLINVSLSDSGVYECEASNAQGKTASTVTVTVHGPPVNTVITVSPEEPKEMESLTISCRSDSNPPSLLILTKVLQGRETKLQFNNGSQVLYYYRLASASDSGLYVCKAINAYGSQTAEVHVNVTRHQLEVSLQPDRSKITVERGSSMNLSCKTSGCPQPSITWRGVKQALAHNSTDSEVVVSQLGPWTVEVDDNRAFTCEVECGSVKEARHTELKVFSFPSDPSITNPGPFLEGKASKLTCSVRDVYPADRFRIQWLDGEMELQSERGTFSERLQIFNSTLYYPLDISDQNKTLTCKVSLEMDDVSRQRSASTTLALHYAPKNTSITVTPAEKLMEGDPVSISCLTDSFPENQVTLKKVLDGEELVLVSTKGTRASLSIRSAELSDAGVYVCEAINKYGHQRDSVQIHVQTPPRNTTVKVYPSTQVSEGQNVTICCQAVSFPPPAIKLRKLDSGVDIYSPNGTFLLMNLTVKDTGMYQVNFTNALGYKTELISIQVMVLESLSSPPPISNYLVLPAVSFGLLASVVGVLEYLRRAKRMGLYKLSTPGKV